MQLEANPFSASALISLAEECLQQGNYQVVRDIPSFELPNGKALLAEDDYSVVAVVAYDSWELLEIEWGDAQAELVALIARKLARSAPKAWDGYLVLMCAAPQPVGADSTEIERDTNRIRKIVASGERLLTTADVAALLDIFMPLQVTELEAADPDILLTVPDLLSDRAPIGAVRAVVEAYKSLEPPLERIHAFLNGAKR